MIGDPTATVAAALISAIASFLVGRGRRNAADRDRLIAEFRPALGSLSVLVGKIRALRREFDTDHPDALAPLSAILHAKLDEVLTALADAAAASPSSDVHRAVEALADPLTNYLACELMYLRLVAFEEEDDPYVPDLCLEVDKTVEQLRVKVFGDSISWQAQRGVNKIVRLVRRLPTHHDARVPVREELAFSIEMSQPNTKDWFRDNPWDREVPFVMTPALQQIVDEVVDGYWRDTEYRHVVRGYGPRDAALRTLLLVGSRAQERGRDIPSDHLARLIAENPAFLDVMTKWGRARDIAEGVVSDLVINEIAHRLAKGSEDQEFCQWLLILRATDPMIASVILTEDWLADDDVPPFR